MGTYLKFAGNSVGLAANQPQISYRSCTLPTGRHEATIESSTEDNMEPEVKADDDEPEVDGDGSGASHVE